MKVRDIMTTGIETASPDTSLQEIARMMQREDVGAIPIIDGDELAGIITDRDIVVRCIAAGKDPADTEAEQILSGDLETAEPDDDVQEASRIMSQRQIRRLPVCEGGRLLGMISIGDIAVKEEEDRAGEALQEISQGVKSEAPARKQPASEGRQSAGSRAGRKSQSSGRDYESELASAGSASRPGNVRVPGAARGKVQPISNRARGDEMERQRRVNPQRAAGSSGRKRRKAS